jgi:pyruvate dehydrogenase E2 component (dihydrolipoamide acetyltransferase)
MTTATTTQEQVFRLPDLGEGLTEAEILEWRVRVGDTVAVDQVVIEVETAKAAVEVPVPFAGTVLALHCEAGAVLDVGAPLISVGAAHPAGERYREEEQAGSGNVLIGYGTGHAPASRRRARVKASQGPAKPSQGPVKASADAPRSAGVISPVVRKLAKENGVDLAGVSASAADGVVRRRDVTAVIEQRKQNAVIPAADDVERIPLKGTRRAVAEKLSRSRSEIPDATTWVDVDATELLNAKLALQTAFPDRRIGLLALLARICVAGLTRFPELNSSVDTERGEILRFKHINLGFAAQTDRGLMVPVIQGAHRLSAAKLQVETARLTGLARAGQLPPAELTGGTFTLNNYGVFGVDGSTPIINHPEAAILGVGRIVDKPWVVDGGLAVRKVTQLSLSFDHRVCDGGVAGGFLRYVADCVERPLALLADL